MSSTPRQALHATIALPLLLMALIPVTLHAENGEGRGGDEIDPRIFNFGRALQPSGPVVAAEGSAGTRGGNCPDDTNCTSVAKKFMQDEEAPKPAQESRRSGIRVVESGGFRRVKNIKARFYIASPGEPQKHGTKEVIPVNLLVKPKLRIPLPYWLNPNAIGMEGNAFDFVGPVPGMSETCEQKSGGESGCSAFFATHNGKVYAQVSGSFTGGRSDLFVIGTLGGKKNEEITWAPGITGQAIRKIYRNYDHVGLVLSASTDAEMLFPYNMSIQRRMGETCDPARLAAKYDYVSTLVESGREIARGTFSLSVVSVNAQAKTAKIKVRKSTTSSFGGVTLDEQVQEGEMEQAYEPFCPQYGFRIVQRCLSTRGNPTKFGELDACQVEFKDQHKEITFAELPFSMAKFIEGGSFMKTEYVYQAPN